LSTKSGATNDPTKRAKVKTFYSNLLTKTKKIGKDGAPTPKAADGKPITEEEEET